MDMETTQSVEEDKFEEYVRVILADSMINHKIKKVIEEAILDGKIDNTYDAAKHYLLQIKDNF